MTSIGIHDGIGIGIGIGSVEDLDLEGRSGWVEDEGTEYCSEVEKLPISI